jgi:hypothetical protein
MAGWYIFAPLGRKNTKYPSFFDSGFARLRHLCFSRIVGSNIKSITPEICGQGLSSFPFLQAASVPARGRPGGHLENPRKGVTSWLEPIGLSPQQVGSRGPFPPSN